MKCPGPTAVNRGSGAEYGLLRRNVNRFFRGKAGSIKPPQVFLCEGSMDSQGGVETMPTYRRYLGLSVKKLFLRATGGRAFFLRMGGGCSLLDYFVEARLCVGLGAPEFKFAVLLPSRRIPKCCVGGFLRGRLLSLLICDSSCRCQKSDQEERGDEFHKLIGHRMHCVT